MRLSLLAFALLLPPSSTLSGPAGTLSWTVRRDGDEVVIEGRSPKWTVSHVAGPDLRPRHTDRTDAKGDRVTVDYTPTGATVTGSKTVVIEHAGLWDGDTLDVRLGALVAAGTQSVDFDALDPAAAKVYGFEARPRGEERCGARACQHIQVQLSGLLKHVGPKWHFWFGDDGALLRFEGPIGAYAVEG